MNEHTSPIVPVFVPLLTLAGFVLLLAGFMLAVQKPIYEMTPTRTGQPERCLTCHYGIEPISASHPTEEFGCVSCHGGDRLATNADAAHTGMVRNPGALDVAQKYCGECHTAQVTLVQRTTMATYAGAIGLVRRSFGLQTDGTAHFAVRAVGDLQAFMPTAQDPAPVQKFAEDCLTCHLYAEPRQETYYYRSTGCSTCHALYANDGLYQGGDPTIPKDKPGYPMRHEFTTAIPYTQCNHCHNRGNYDLRTMTFVQRNDMAASATLSGQALRLHDYYQPIGQFTKCEWELDCIDCHTSQEIMGSGQIYNNRTEAQYIQCSTCHGTLDSPPQSEVVQSEQDLAIVRANLNPNVDLYVSNTIIVTTRGEPMWHVQKIGDQWILTDKATGQQYVVPLVKGSKCQQKPDQQASQYCHECHTVDRQGASP